MAAKPSTAYSPSALLSAILRTTMNQIIPITRESFANGGAPFGAAVLDQSNLEPVTIAVNAWQECPLFHGETNCIRQFYQIPPEQRPDTGSCIFFSTHEPCSLCLSGFAWTGFKLIFFLFTYEETHELLGVTGDVEILQEIFRVPALADTPETLAARPLYNKQNKFFSIKSIADLVEEAEDSEERKKFGEEVQKVRRAYDEFRVSRV